MQDLIRGCVTQGRPDKLIGDKAYDSDPLDRECEALGVTLIAPHKRNRVKPKTQDGRPLLGNPHLALPINRKRTKIRPDTSCALKPDTLCALYSALYTRLTAGKPVCSIVHVFAPRLIRRKASGGVIFCQVIIDESAAD